MMLCVRVCGIYALCFPDDTAPRARLSIWFEHTHRRRMLTYVRGVVRACVCWRAEERLSEKSPRSIDRLSVCLSCDVGFGWLSCQTSSVCGGFSSVTIAWGWVLS
jgi:hypothetical protein